MNQTNWTELDVIHQPLVQSEASWELQRAQLIVVVTFIKTVQRCILSLIHSAMPPQPMCCLIPLLSASCKTFTISETSYQPNQELLTLGHKNPVLNNWGSCNAEPRASLDCSLTRLCCPCRFHIIIHLHLFIYAKDWGVATEGS